MILLGSSGSIGKNTLFIAQRYNIDVDVLSVNTNVELLNEQIKEFSPSIVVVGDSSLKSKVNHKNVLVGQSGILEAINSSKSNLVVNALVGFAGLKPTLETLKVGKKLALANKESLVVAGKFVNTSKIIPIDSEHFALWYLLQNNKKFNKLIITASGGSFRDTPLTELPNVSIQDALKHPNWSMGQQITIDSATMTNKLYELLEARWLFGSTNVDAIIETKSLIHGFVEHVDGSTTAHFANPSMQLPIAFSICDKVEDEVIKPVDLFALNSLEFRKIEEKRYPIWQIKEYILENPHLGVVLNAANEVAVRKFLDGTIGFLDISKMVIKTLEKFDNVKPQNIEDIFMIDKEVKSNML